MESRGGRKSLVGLVTVEALWGLGGGMASYDALVPALIVALGGSSVEVGLLAAITAVAGWIPRLLAGLVARRLRGLWPFVTYGHVALGVCWGILALLTHGMAIGAISPLVYRRLLLVVFALYFAGMELLVPVWQSLLSAVAGEGRYGRLMGILQVSSISTGVLGGYLASHLARGAIGFHGYALLFAANAALMTLGNLGWLMVEEPAAPASRPVEPLREYLARVLALLSRPGALRELLMVVVLLRASVVLTAFYVAQVQRTLSLGAADVALLGMATTVGMGVGALATAVLGDRVRPAPMLTGAICALALALSVALAPAHWSTALAVVALSGAFMAASFNAQTSMALALAPKGEEVTYLSVWGLASGVSGAILSLGAGALIDRWGYRLVLGLALGLVCLAALRVCLGALRAPGREPEEEHVLGLGAASH